MEVFSHSHNLKIVLSQLKPECTLGFVPTMGALHQGHLALVKASVQSCDKTIASVFVNKKQFNNPNDYQSYPRTIEQDIAMLEEAGVDYVFVPEQESELFDDDFKSISVTLHDIDTRLEGEFRPGHFQGVVDVVHQFFDLIKPQKAFFGLKDFQQYSIIKKLAQQHFPDLEIIGIETLREKSGLAMSSRNVLLSVDARRKAKELYASLKAVQSAGDHALNQKEKEKHRLNALGFNVEYFEIIETANFNTLQKLDKNKDYRIFLAAQLDGVRLIDNVALNA